MNFSNYNLSRGNNIMNIQIFGTCFVDIAKPEIRDDMISVLADRGVVSSFPKDQICCGQPAYNIGFYNEARKVAEHLITVLYNTDTPIVSPSGSCVAMLKHGYEDLFKNDYPILKKARAVAERTYEFSQFLEYIKADFSSLALHARIAFHHSCHQRRILGIYDQPINILKQIEGVETVEYELEDRCCGFGGMYSVEYPKMSSIMAEMKAKAIIKSSAEYLVGTDAACLLTLEKALRKLKSGIRVMHLAELLAGLIKDGSK